MSSLSEFGRADYSGHAPHNIVKDQRYRLLLERDKTQHVCFWLQSCLTVTIQVMQHQELVFCVLQKVSLQIKQSWNDAGQCFGIVMQYVHLHSIDASS